MRRPPRSPSKGSAKTTRRRFTTAPGRFAKMSRTVSGRPYRSEGRPCRPEGEIGHDAWCSNPAAPGEQTLAHMSEAERSERSIWWARAAADEHASVAAFNRLSLDLLSVAAPPSLLHACQNAAMDEIAHAQLCYAMASGFAGVPVGPGVFPQANTLERIYPDGREATLCRIAVESLVDGCYGESQAVAQATDRRRCSSDPSERAVLQRIADDEARHVTLAWNIVAWCVHAGGEAVERRLRWAAASRRRKPASGPVVRRLWAFLDGTRRSEAPADARRTQ